jgi:hypothetical protein
MDKNGGYFRIVPEDNGATSQIDAILKGTSASITKLRSVAARAEDPVSPLFIDHLRTQAQFMLGLNQTLHAAAQAMADLPDKRKAVKSLEEAGRSLASLRGILHEAEHDRFAGWYDGERVFGLEKLSQRLQTTIQDLQ